MNLWYWIRIGDDYSIVTIVELINQQISFEEQKPFHVEKLNQSNGF